MTHSTHQGARQRAVLAASLLILASLGWMSPASANEADAQQAISRAEGKLDILSRESPAATQSPSFTQAHDRLTQARTFLAEHDNRKAEWMANEAEVKADETAGAGQLAKLQQTRADLGHDVEILDAKSHS